MICPACKNPLLEKSAGGMTLDMCYGGCGGIWFDADELDKVTPRAATTLHTIWQGPVDVKKLTEPRKCPRCEGQVLDRKWFSDRKQVEIDQCPVCGGVWLDAGEFSRVYEEMHTAKVAPTGWAQAMAEAAKIASQQSAPGGTGAARP
jgi:Zn-finger nucleic acid-binding protein